MTVLFLDKYEHRRKVKEVSTLQEGYQAIYEFLNKYHYKVLYMRMWQEENEIWIDVGSHTEFFIIECENINVAERSLKAWIDKNR